MSLADNLLALVKMMANYKKSDVLEARLRRAISTAYYAVFHLLSEHGAARLVAHSGLQMLVGRAYVHNDMVKAAKAFQSGLGGLPSHLTVPFRGSVPRFASQISRVAKAFVALHEARQEADYNRAATFSRAEARGLIDQADNAFTDWKTVVDDPSSREMCELFLATLLLGERWKR